MSFGSFKIREEVADIIHLYSSKYVFYGGFR